MANPFDPGRGFLDPRIVRAVAFYVTVGCVSLSIVTAILAIWDFAKRDVLGRLLATYCVVAVGVLLFSLVNQWFGEPGRSNRASKDES